MSETIRFDKEIDALREAGFTEEQTQAIWHLVAHVVIEVVTRYEWREP